MRGILLAGGHASRMRPASFGVSKQLMPIYDKPLFFYPLSILMLLGIRQISLICKTEDHAVFNKYVGDGAQLGLAIKYFFQDKPVGIADAFNIVTEYREPTALILGDNFFYGQGLVNQLNAARRDIEFNGGAHLFTQHVDDPGAFGVAQTNSDGVIIDIIEKPVTRDFKQAVTGLYFYDHLVFQSVKKLIPSPRGELEITDLNKEYLARQALQHTELGRGVTWLDTGTPDNLFQAADFVRVVENRQGKKIACLEEIAYRNDWINREGIENAIQRTAGSGYSDYLGRLLN